MSIHPLIKKATVALAQHQFQEASTDFRKYLQIHPNDAEIWFKQGSTHEILKELGLAIYAFSKARHLNKTKYSLMCKHKEALALSELQDTPIENLVYLEQRIRPIACKEEYIDQLKIYETNVADIRNKTFTTQVQTILELIQFLKTYHGGQSQHPYPFMKQELFEKTDTAQELRMSALGEWLLKQRPKNLQLHDNYIEILDDQIIKMLQTAQQDIRYEDSKKILRMIFQVIYFFPREQRGALIPYLPKAFNAWYLFDYCGAILCDDKAYETLASVKGSPFIPYQHDNPQENNQQSYFIRSIKEHALVVKVACTDLIQEMNVLLDFFSNIDKQNPQKMRDLPQLKALLHYSRHLFSHKRMLCLLPLSTRNCPMTDPSFNEMGLDIRNTPGMPELFDQIRREATPDQRDMVTKLTTEIFSRLIPTPIPSAPRSSTSAAALSLSASTSKIRTNFNTLKSRLSLIRKLQLVGELFTPRNWNGPDLKKILYIDVRGIYDMRVRLVHIEEYPDILEIIERLESDPSMIQGIYKDLQKLRDSIHQSIVWKQSYLPAWPENGPDWGSTGPENWTPFVKKYWTLVKDFFSNTVQSPPFISNEPLLEESEITNLVSHISSGKSDLENILKGTVPWPSDDIILTYKNQLNSLSKNPKKKMSKLFVRAQQTMQRQRNAYAKKKMPSVYPNLHQLKQQLFACSRTTTTPMRKFEILSNRIQMLQDLIGVSQDTNSICKFLTDDIDFALAVNYLFGQIFELINQKDSLAHLESLIPTLGDDLELFSSLRNHLEHTDPIFETATFPYYEMESNVHPLTTSVIVKLITIYSPAIKNYDFTSFSQDEMVFIELSSTIKPVQQERALDPDRFL